MNKINNILINNKKKVIIIISIIIILLLVIFIINGIINKNNKNKDNNGIILNTNKGIIEKIKFEDLDIDNITLYKDNKNKMYIFNADAINNTNKNIKVDRFNIEFYDKDNKLIITLLGYIGVNISPNSKTTINATTSIDLSKAVKKKLTKYDASKFTNNKDEKVEEKKAN